MSTTTIETPDREAMAREHTGLVERAKAFRIENATDHEEGLVIFRDLKARWKAVDDKLKPIIDAAHKAHKGLTSLRAELFAPIEEAIRAIERKCLEFTEAQRRKAEEAQRVAQENARKAEEERMLREAQAAEAEGDHAAAEEIISQPVEAPLIAVAPVVAQVKGVSGRTTWSAEVTDKAKLIAYVNAHPEWLHLVEPNMPMLNSLAKAQQKALAIPGVRAVPKEGLSARTS